MSHCLQPGCLNQNADGQKFCQKCGAKLLLAERYRAIKIIGQGGFGRTFRAVDEFKPSKPACVIKQFLPQAQGTDTIEKAAELFQAEAVRLDELGKHGQIPELLAYFSQEDRQYLVQEFIEGENLGQELEKKGKLKEGQIRELLRDILNILEFVHEKEVIHRDIKPDNIIRRAGDHKLVLVDFGAAKVLANKRISVTGTVIGSAEYTSPEQGIGKAIYASDLYSLGVTCIHLLTQVSPFDLYDISEHDWVWRDYLLDNQVSAELGKILDKLIVQATKRRYQSAKEVLKELTPPTAFTGQAQQTTSSPPTSRGVNSPSGQTPASSSTPISRGLGGVKSLEIGNGVRMELVEIPAGSFLMGGKVQINLESFLMGKYPVTQEQWEAVMGDNPSDFKGNKRPVEQVSWDNAQEFCLMLSGKTGEKFRLPSEAEWEYACRAGTTTKYFFGNNDSALDNYAWFSNNSNGETHSVGGKNPNPWGLYDLLGNVSEWCEDDYVSNLNSVPKNGSPVKNNNNHTKRLRGGSCYNYAPYCTSVDRFWNARNYRNRCIGFRVVFPFPSIF